jgi:hypothetical protein
MVADRNPEVKQAVVKLLELSADERARDLFERREKERRDIASREKWARREGWLDVAKNLMKKNMSVNEIVDVTGLTHAEVVGLLDN